MSRRAKQLYDPDVHRCEMCHKTGASYVKDPYDADVYNRTTMRWLCDDCYQELCYDI